MPLDASSMCPLMLAVIEGFVGVVRTLIDEGGIRAAGGEMAMPNAIYASIRCRRAVILLLLLAVDGEGRRPEWANRESDGRTLLHYGTGYFCPAAVSILLEAGADEEALDTEWRIPGDATGVDLGRDGGPEMDPEKEVAIRRILQCGLGYRAQSWAWPCDEEEDAGGSGGGDSPLTGQVGKAF